MRSRLLCFAFATSGLILTIPTGRMDAAPTAAQRRELTKIRGELTKAASLIRRKKIDEATKIVDDAEKRLEKVVKDAKLTKRNRTVAGLKRLIQLRKNSLLRAQGKNAAAVGISYEKQVAPILRQRCARCHTNNARGGLRIDRPASLRKVIAAGNARGSRLIQRITSPNVKQRMPKGGRPLSRTEINTIMLWINQGAKIGGKAITKKTPAKKPVPKVIIAIATGKEKVSFTKDIAPFMVNLCLNCHNDRRKSGGLSLATFEKLMQGGKSGRVVLPGDTAGSRLWDLVGMQKPFKMPRGQARILPSNWRNLRTWIEEGAKYDGGDAKKTLRSLVPTERELKAARFARFSAQQFAQFRQKRTEETWNRVLPKEKPRYVESKEFFVYGNVSAARLTQIDKWAEEHATRLRKLFKDKSSLLFKGKLAIIVMKDRFGYEEFNLVIQRREIPRAMMGHTIVDSLYEDAYIVLQNVDDEASDSNPGMTVNVIDHLTGAFMKRGGGKLPDWVLRGTGLALASQAEPKNSHINGLRDKVPGLLRNVQSPEAIFANGTFSPVDVGAVGYTLVEFLLRGGGGLKYGKFIASIQRGNSVAGAMKTVYQADMKSMARAYARQVGKKRRKRKR